VKIMSGIWLVENPEISSIGVIVRERLKLVVVSSVRGRMNIVSIL